MKNSVTWSQAEDKNDLASHLKKLGEHYVGTKDVIHEPINYWETCHEYSAKCDYCPNCALELIGDHLMMVNDDTLLTKLVDEAVKKSVITFETTVLHARQYATTKDKVETMTAPSCQKQVNFT